MCVFLRSSVVPTERRGLRGDRRATDYQSKPTTYIPIRATEPSPDFRRYNVEGIQIAIRF